MPTQNKSDRERRYPLPADGFISSRGNQSMSRVIHPDQPRCVHCGNARGPWQPTGDHDARGVQLFECADGHGCQAERLVALTAVAEYVDQLPTTRTGGGEA